MERIILAEILHNHEIAKGIFKIHLRIPADYPEPRPGQFVNLYVNDKSMLLPRPISVCDWEEGMLTLVYAVVGEGTQIISRYARGVQMRCSTPLGNWYLGLGLGLGMNMCLLVGGGVGIPPLLYLTRQLEEHMQNVKAVLGFKSEPFLNDEFPCDVEISTDDGSAGFKGNVIELLETMDIPSETQIFACGPKPMLKALAEFAGLRGIPLQVSLEAHMGCGYGACVGCTCKTIHGNRKVCEDGPVFDGSEVVWNE